MKPVRSSDGRAPDLGSGVGRFESCRTDQIKFIIADVDEDLWKDRFQGEAWSRELKLEAARKMDECLDNWVFLDVEEVFDVGLNRFLVAFKFRGNPK